MSLCRSALLAAALLLLAPAAAQAATVSLAGATLSYVAAEGEANDLSVSLAAGVYTLTDAAGEPVTAGAGCLQVLPAQATCPSAGITLLSLDARDRADVIHIGPGTANATLTGGAGDDVITGGDGADTLNGGTDADRLDGGAGIDTLNGDWGDDTLIGGLAADTFNGGAGTDLADYSARVSAVTIWIDAPTSCGAATGTTRSTGRPATTRSTAAPATTP
jgi:Ca2+-binding RTX toxin-like protein